MKGWQLLVALIVPGGLFALVVMAFLRLARDRTVSPAWLREQSYSRSGDAQ